MALELEAGKLAIAALRALYKADRANVYVLPLDAHFIIKVRLPAFDGTYLRFIPAVSGEPLTAVTVKAYGRRDEAGNVVCDGATFAPDSPIGVRPAAGIHDPGYLEMDAMTIAWAAEPYNPGPNFSRDFITRLTSRDSPTWTAADVRQLIDAIFGDAMRKFRARPAIYRLYYSAARYFGRLAHGRVATLIALALGLSLLTCCNGCMSPPDITEFPDGPPVLNHVESGHIDLHSLSLPRGERSESKPPAP